MEVDLDRIPVSADSQKAVALEVLDDVVEDLVFIKIISVDQKLCIISEFKHFEISSLVSQTLTICTVYRKEASKSS